MIRKATLNDVKVITNIYNYYVENEMPTFEENPVTTDFFKEKISTSSDRFPWLVYELNSSVIGYAYASPWKPRSGYRFTAEISIYLQHNNTEKGIGSLLYKELIKQLKEKGFNSIIGGITLPNPPCVRLHEKFGFEKVAQFKQIGTKFNKWADVGYWQLLLNE
ncbi:GNAT family N-acetyltransferase [Pseudofulvibacter geojedonensis]|uniref:GNAT family N-acetyltransferase n=1 Tax=Pseudofulvibacter geojedonensis TaxID=1123758 RepID=A0ABW3I2N9_9FLAO